MSTTLSARFLAYRWYRTENLESSHKEAWEFALAHWRDFLGQLSDNPEQQAGPSPAPIILVVRSLPRE